MRNLLINSGFANTTCISKGLEDKPLTLKQRTAGAQRKEKCRREYTKNEGDACKKNAPPSRGGERLEVETQAELHPARSVSGGQVHESRAAETGINRISSVPELSVVKEVKRFPFEIEAGSLRYREPLGNAEIEIDSAGQGKRVAADVAKCEAGRQSERCRIVEERSEGTRIIRAEPGVRIADKIRARSSAGRVANARVVAEVGAIAYAKWRTGLGNSDSEGRNSICLGWK